MCRKHVEMLTAGQEPRWRQHLYRIFFYDAEPFDGKAHHPIDNRSIDFEKSEVARERRALFDQLRKERKLALRLGKVTRDHNWAIDPALTKKLLRTREYVKALDLLTASGEGDQDAPISLQLTPAQARDLIALRDLWHSLDGKSVRYGLRQKGVDIRIGLDITTLTLKKQVDTIILISGDSDFVPAAKLARREGIEFILDPLWQQVNGDLFEHIDGLQSGLKRPGEPSTRTDVTAIAADGNANPYLR